jgi:hypothetical protein
MFAWGLEEVTKRAVYDNLSGITVPVSGRIETELQQFKSPEFSLPGDGRTYRHNIPDTKWLPAGR